MLQLSFICLPGWKWIWSNLSQIWYSPTPLHGQNSNHTSLGAPRIPRPDCCKSNPLVSGHEGLKCWSLLPASMVKQNCSVRLKIHFPITDLSFYCWWLKWLRLCGILWKFKFHLNISSLYHSKAAKNFDPLVITIRRVPSLEKQKIM